MLLNLRSNCHGFATGCHKFYLFSFRVEMAWSAKMATFSCPSMFFSGTLTWMLKKLFSLTSVVVRITLWWNLCRALEVFRSYMSKQRIMYAVCAMD